MKSSKKIAFTTRRYPIAMAVSMLFAPVLLPSAFAATCTVTNTNDSGAGSLRNCISTASSGDTIDLSGQTGTISLTTVDTTSTYTPSGQGATSDTTSNYPGDTLLVLNKNLTLQGPTGSTLALDGGSTNTSTGKRLIYIPSGVNITIKNLTLQNGRARSAAATGGGGGGAGLGGAILNEGTLTLQTVTMSGNRAVGSAGSAGTNGGNGGSMGSAAAATGAFGRGGAGGSGADGSAGGFGGGGGGGSQGTGGHQNGFNGAAGGFGGGGGGGGAKYACCFVNGTAGSGGFGAANASYGSGGASAGLGAAVFARTGSVTLKDVIFNANAATSGGGTSTGRGGALFICTATEDAANCSATIDETASCGAVFGTGGSSNTSTTGQATLYWSGAGGGAHSTAGIADSCVAAPTATSNAATGLSATGATLNGTINDNGANTTVTFDYGLTVGYGTNVAATTGGTVTAGSGSTAVAKTLAGLSCGTTYHFRVKGVNSSGTTLGGDLSFSTSTCPPDPVPICGLTATPSQITAGGISTLLASCSPGATSYTWTNSGFGASVAGGTVSPAVSTTYSVVGRNENGPGNTASARVAVLPTCTLTATPATIVAGASSTLSASCAPAATSYSWTKTGFASTAASGSVTPPVTTQYSVIGSNADGSSAAATVTVSVLTPVDVRTYIPVAEAATGYLSSLRVINTGNAATPVFVAVIDGATGSAGKAAQLSASLAAGAAQTFSAQQIETALGISIGAGERPRIRVSSSASNIDVQSLLQQPGGVFNDVTGAQAGSSVAVATYVPAAAASFGYVSNLRIINTGTQTAAVTIAKIDPASGRTGAAAVLNPALPAGAAVTYTAQQIETALGAPISAAERPRILVSAAGSTLDVQSFLRQPGGAFAEVSSAQSGYSVNVRSYVPAAAANYTSFLRIINSGANAATSVFGSVIDDATGAVLGSGTLVQSLPPGAAVTLSSSQVEIALGIAIAAGSRPRIQVSSSGLVASPLQIQSFLLQPGGAYNEISNAIGGGATDVRTYIPLADAASGYVSYLRVINPGTAATPVNAALIDAASGTVGPVRVLLASLPGGAARIFSSAMIEAVLGSVAAGTRPRIQITGNTPLEIQSFLMQPGGAFTEVSGGQ